MNDSGYQLNKISLLTGVGIFCFKNGNLKAFRENNGYNPICEQESFRSELMEQAEKQEIPLLYQDRFQVFFGCIKKDGAFYLFGPMSVRSLSNVELHQYYRMHGMTSGMGKMLPKLSLTGILIVTEFIAKEVSGKEYQDEELMQGNRLLKNLGREVEKEQIIFQLKEEEREAYHHTYREEQKLLSCVREGRVEDALQYCMDIDMEMGKLSSKEINHWRNVVVVAVTLCTRAAIEGGVSPETAYQISDFYIQKCEGYEEVSALISCRNRAVKDLAERVRKRREGRKISNYVEQCKDYISRHYREKIYLDDMAEQLGLSSTYLSRLFKKETNVCIQDYVNDVRVERAANLLLYSEESISRIAEYVNFPSQSYFGKIFKSRKHMTPKQFRDMYKPTEFLE